MADSKKAEKASVPPSDPKIRKAKGWKDFWSDILIAAGVDLVWSKLKAIGAERISQHVHQHLVDHYRADILEDLKKLDPKDNQNLLRRHREALANHTENDFIALLGKIHASEDPATKRKSRAETLQWLNGLDDAEFNQMLEVLRHDPLVQTYQRIRESVRKIFEGKFDSAKEIIAGIFPLLMDFLKTGNNILRFGIFAGILCIVIGCFAALLPTGAWIAVPLIALLGCLILGGMLLFNPLAILAIALFAKGRKIFKKFFGVIAIALLVSLYLSIVPVSNDRGLFLLTLLVIATIIVMILAGKEQMIILPVLALIVLTAIFFLGGRESVKRKIATAQQRAQDLRISTSLTRTGSEKGLCEDAVVADYTDKNPSSIEIPLTEGCYGNEVMIPFAWNPKFIAQQIQTPDGYASVWCSGESRPRPVRRVGEDLTLTMNDCFGPGDRTAHFRSQGKGRLILRQWRGSPTFRF